MRKLSYLPLEEIKKNAHAGYVDSQLELAFRHNHKPRNETEAIALFGKVLDNPHADIEDKTTAEYQLGLLHHAREQSDKAIEHFTEAAQNDHVAASEQLGIIYLTAKDYIKGATWLFHALRLGSDFAKKEILTNNFGIKHRNSNEFKAYLESNEYPYWNTSNYVTITVDSTLKSSQRSESSIAVALVGILKTYSLMEIFKVINEQKNKAFYDYRGDHKIHSQVFNIRWYKRTTAQSIFMRAILFDAKSVYDFIDYAYNNDVISQQLYQEILSTIINNSSNQGLLDEVQYQLGALNLEARFYDKAEKHFKAITNIFEKHKEVTEKLTEIAPMAEESRRKHAEQEQHRREEQRRREQKLQKRRKIEQEQRRREAQQRQKKEEQERHQREVQQRIEEQTRREQEAKEQLEKLTAEHRQIITTAIKLLHGDQPEQIMPAILMLRKIQDGPLQIEVKQQLAFYDKRDVVLQQLFAMANKLLRQYKYERKEKEYKGKNLPGDIIFGNCKKRLAYIKELRALLKSDKRNRDKNIEKVIAKIKAGLSRYRPGIWSDVMGGTLRSILNSLNVILDNYIQQHYQNIVDSTTSTQIPLPSAPPLSPKPGLGSGDE